MNLCNTTGRPRVVPANFNGSAVVVDLPVFVVPGEIFNKTWTCFEPEGVHVGVDQDLDEGQQEVEDQPDVDHLDVRRFRQVVRHVDEHGGQHEHS